jgi:Glu-tRNA(Gln) amidotransferase subunit E-like FAD-binding protein
VTGVVGADRAPPHNFSREAIQEAINVEGFQLWRVVKKAEARA